MDDQHERSVYSLPSVSSVLLCALCGEFVLKGIVIFWPDSVNSARHFTLENAIAALASIGLSSNPLTGNKIPAAMGMPIRL